jgi:tetratricopeptide (TPR) repeat protein
VFRSVTRYRSFLVHAILVTALSARSAELASLDAAEALFEGRRYAEAQPLFEAVLETEPDNTLALLHLGKLAAKRGERELAVDYLERATRIAPHDAELLFEFGAASCFYADSLGTSFKALLAVRRGREAMIKSIEMEPNNLVFRQGLLEFYAGAPAIVGGSMRKAHAQADAIAAIDPDHGNFARANLQLAERDPAAAMTTLEAMIQRAPDNYFALFQFGRCAAESGLQMERGLSFLARCLELPAPDKAAPPAQVWWRIGQIRSRQGDIAGAREAMLQAQTLAPHETRIATEIAALPELSSK